MTLDGPLDLKAAIPVQKPVCGTPVITNLIGGSPDEQPERFRAASPMELLPIGVRQELPAGRMFAAQYAPYATAAIEAGDTLRTTLLPDAGRFVFINPQSEVWPEVLAAVRCMVSAD
jgi:hypothetical protein